MVMKDFYHKLYNEQIEWYRSQVEWYKDMIAFAKANEYEEHEIKMFKNGVARMRYHLKQYEKKLKNL